MLKRLTFGDDDLALPAGHLALFHGIESVVHGVNELGHPILEKLAVRFIPGDLKGYRYSIRWGYVGYKTSTRYA